MLKLQLTNLSHQCLSNAICVCEMRLVIEKNLTRHKLLISE